MKKFFLNKKLMTALVAAEFGNFDRMMTVSEAAAAVDGSQMGLLAEQTISFSDLLYMMLLKSGNLLLSAKRVDLLK